MKKLLLILTGIYLLAFNLNQSYKCETLGFTFKRNGKVYNIPNDIKTNKQMQKDLGKLYEINFVPLKDAIKLTVGGKDDILPFINTIKNRLNVYITKDRQVIVFVDKNVSQIALKIPSQQMIIYYQCK
jgi:hypothetical protein